MSFGSTLFDHQLVKHSGVEFAAVIWVADVDWFQADTTGQFAFVWTNLKLSTVGPTSFTDKGQILRIVVDTVILVASQKSFGLF